MACLITRMIGVPVGADFSHCRTNSGCGVGRIPREQRVSACQVYYNFRLWMIAFGSVDGEQTEVVALKVV